jgi:hypothetical protein
VRLKHVSNPGLYHRSIFIEKYRKAEYVQCPCVNHRHMHS